MTNVMIILFAYVVFSWHNHGYCRRSSGFSRLVPLVCPLICLQKKRKRKTTSTIVLRQLWLVLGEKLMEINNNFFSRMMFMTWHMCIFFQEKNRGRCSKKSLHRIGVDETLPKTNSLPLKVHFQKESSILVTNFLGAVLVSGRVDHAMICQCFAIWSCRRMG